MKFGEIRLFFSDRINKDIGIRHSADSVWRETFPGGEASWRLRGVGGRSPLTEGEGWDGAGEGQERAGREPEEGHGCFRLPEAPQDECAPVYTLRQDMWVHRCFKTCPLLGLIWRKPSCGREQERGQSAPPPPG